MIIDKVLETIPGKISGVWATILGLLVFTSPIALVFAFRTLNKVKLAAVKVEKSNNNVRYNLWMVWWGLIILCIGVAILIVTFRDDTLENRWVPYVLGGCEAVTGFFMFMYGLVYSESTIKDADQLLIHMKKNGSINTTVNFKGEGITIVVPVLKNYIEEFKKYHIVELREEDGLCRVVRMHPYLERWFAEHPDAESTEKKESAESRSESTQWICTGCGAVNTSSQRCEYCNNLKK